MSTTWLPRLAVTMGEPSGVGAELVAALAATPIAADLIAIGDTDLLRAAAATRGITLTIEDDDGQWRSERAPGSLRAIHLPLSVAATPGQLDQRNAAHVVAMLVRASNGCLEGEFDAVVTAPVHKGIINDAGITFTGHTEFFSARARCDVVMLLVAPGLRVALATTHLPLSEVPAAVTAASLLRILRIVYNDLRHRFGIDNPRIAVLGLNPHAGESGHLGREDLDVIAPAIAAARARGIDAEGPLPADTLFVPTHARAFDAILAMYHDQGLPVLKAASFGHGVNVTLGLPFVRTSVDHGTALDLAGDAARAATADAGSLWTAIELAIALARRVQ